MGIHVSVGKGLTRGHAPPSLPKPSMSSYPIICIRVTAMFMSSG